MQNMRQQDPNKQYPQNEEEDSQILKTENSAARKNTSTVSLKRHSSVTDVKAAFVRDTIDFY